MAISVDELQKSIDELKQISEDREKWVEKMAEFDDMAAQLKEQSKELERIKENRRVNQKAREILANDDPQFKHFMQNGTYVDSLEMSEQEKAGFLKWALGAARSETARDFNEYLQKATLNENTNSEGLYLVPTQYLDGIIGQMQQNSIFLRDATRVPMVGKSANQAVWATGWTVWVGAESASITAGEPTFGQVVLNAAKFIAYGVGSAELFEDSGPNLVDALIKKATNDVSAKVDSVAWGSTGTDFSGFTGLAEIAGNQVTIASTSFAALTYANLNSGVETLSTVRVKGAKWYMSPKVFSVIRGLTDSDGRPLWGLDITGSFASVLGYPVVLVDAMPGTAAASQNFLFFGNLEHCPWGDRRSLSFERGRKLQTDQWEMLFKTRVGLPNLANAADIKSNWVRWTSTAS